MANALRNPLGNLDPIEVLRRRASPSGVGVVGDGGASRGSLSELRPRARFWRSFAPIRSEEVSRWLPRIA